MRYVLDISNEIDEQIRELIRKGKYEIVQDFLHSAIVNWLYIERNGDSSNSAELSVLEEKIPREQYNLLSYANALNVQSVAEPSSKSLYSENEPLWGLANRLFPVKITVRVLSNILTQGETSVIREDLLEQAFAAASNLGSQLYKADKKRHRKRSGRLSEALPIGPKDKKSKSRFLSQFIGGITFSTGKMFGAPANLRFVNIIPNAKGDEMFALTANGLKFASIRNPIIDDHNFDTNSFSEEEIHFLIRHILDRIPGEAKGILAILNEISEGKVSTNDFIPAIKKLFNYSDDTKATTVKVGLVGRMVELGLIYRKKVGPNVMFGLTRIGEDVLQRYSANHIQQRVEAI